jgi:hypothetical protein
MKHLKPYRIFESFRKEGIMNDILDISLDIQDEGFRVRDVSAMAGSTFMSTSDIDTKSDFIITIDKFNGYRESFDIKEIKDFLIRVIEYGNLNPCDIKVYVPQRSHSNQRDLIELRHLKSEWILDYRISYVDIYVRSFN